MRRPDENDADGFEARVNAFLATEPSPKRVAARRAGQAVRELVDRLAATSAPEEELEAVAAAVEVVSARLAGFSRGRIFEGFAESSTSGDPAAFFDYSPILGIANPLAPPLHVRVEDETVVGEITWGSAYEGPPGCVHGGYLAAAFDEVLGMTQNLGGAPGMTGTLTIRYRRPTPLYTSMRFEGVLERVEGRKIFTTGRLLDPEGNLTAEAEAVFIRVDFGRLATLADERERRAAES